MKTYKLGLDELNILVNDITKEQNPIALIAVDRLIQFYNFNDGLSIDEVISIIRIRLHRIR